MCGESRTHGLEGGKTPRGVYLSLHTEEIKCQQSEIFNPVIADSQLIPEAPYRDEKPVPDQTRDKLTEMLSCCSDGWMEAVDTALARGASFEFAIKATQLWLAGNYELADLLLQMGKDVHYTAVADRETLEGHNSAVRS